MPRIRNDRSEATDELFRGILSLRDVEECYLFLSAPKFPPAALPSPG